MKKLTAVSVIKELRKHGTPAKAKSSAWFFKTDEGQYGYGDVFLGVTVPEQRKIAKRYSYLTFEELAKLLHNKIHECRLTALLILVDQHKRADKKRSSRIVQFYLANKRSVNNWDLVDSSAPYILGDYLIERSRATLYKLARSKDLWQRRTAIVATYAFIRKNDYKDTLAIAEILLHDKHDLLHKAVGWMLREVGKRSRMHEEGFLKKYVLIMPRTMLRYAIERFPENSRKAYLAMRPQRYETNIK